VGIDCQVTAFADAVEQLSVYCRCWNMSVMICCSGVIVFSCTVIFMVVLLVFWDWSWRVSYQCPFLQESGGSRRNDDARTPVGISGFEFICSLLRACSGS